MFPVEAKQQVASNLDVASALGAVQTRITTVTRAAGRMPEEVRLLAVSKTFPASAVRAAHAAGQTAFGENYVQEGVAKATELADLGLEWHFIGPLQSNKTKPVAETFAWVHSIERLKIAERLSAQRPPHLPKLQVLIQVNVSGEESKSGIAPGEVLELARGIAALRNLQLRGLMAIPEPTNDLEILRTRFNTVGECLKSLTSQGFSVDTMSMGMSADLETAIACGSTMVRVGTAIFGGRG